MIFKRYSSEKGQVLVILTVGIVALLAFAAIAIDGGMFYVDRRHDQNVADDSSMAGAGAAGKALSDNNVYFINFNCVDDNKDGILDDANMQAVVDAAAAEAVYRAGQNNFTSLPVFYSESALEASEHGVWVECVDNGTGLGDQYLAVHVMISNDVQSSFAQLFFGGTLRNTVEAVSITEAATGLGTGKAIVALEGEDCKNGGLEIGGSTPISDPKIRIIDSGAHSNSCLTCEGSAVTIDSDAVITYNFSDVDTKCKEDSILGEPLATPGDKIPIYDIDVNCGSDAYQNDPKIGNKDDVTLFPGNYKAITQTGGSLTFKPGLYCIQGVFSVNGGSVVVEGDPDDDDGITIYSASGNITINGSGAVNLRAPRSDPKYTTPASLSYARPTIPGLLIYSDLNVKNPPPIKLNGTEDAIFRGTVYYPYGSITISGDSSNTQWLVEVLANEVIITGNSSVNITYDARNGHQGFATLSLEK
jgi:hypothetical protein